MNTHTPRASRRALSVLVAGAFAGAALVVPTVSAYAVTPVVAAPTSVDASGWNADKFSVVNVTNVLWKWKVGSGSETAIATTGTVETTPFSSDPGANATVTVTAYDTGNGNAQIGSPYVLNFSNAVTVEVTGLPTDLTWTDKDGYLADTFTVPKVAHVTWKYTGGGKTDQAITMGTSSAIVKPFAALPTDGVVTVKAYADAGYTLPSGKGTYTKTFSTDTGAALAKMPTIAVDKTTTYNTISVPYVKGVKWTLAQATDGAYGAAAAVTFPGTVPVVLKSGSGITAGTKKVKLVAAADTNFSLLNLKPTATTFVYKVKSEDTSITKPGNGAIDLIDEPGIAKDYASVKGLEGVEWFNGLKKISVKVGAYAKVLPDKTTGKVTLTAKPALGYKFSDNSTSVDLLQTFDLKDDSAVEPTLDGLSATISFSAAIKQWAFMPDGKTTVMPIAFPKGAEEFTVVLPGKGKLIATPDATRYTLTKGTAVDGATNGSKYWTVTPPA